MKLKYQYFNFLSIIVHLDKSNQFKGNIGIKPCYDLLYESVIQIGDQ